MFELGVLQDTLRAEEFLVIFAEKFDFFSRMRAAEADTCFYIGLTGVGAWRIAGSCGHHLRLRW